MLQLAMVIRFSISAANTTRIRSPKLGPRNFRQGYGFKAFGKKQAPVPIFRHRCRRTDESLSFWVSAEDGSIVPLAMKTLHQPVAGFLLTVPSFPRAVLISAGSLSSFLLNLLTWRSA